MRKPGNMAEIPPESPLHDRIKTLVDTGNALMAAEREVERLGDELDNARRVHTERIAAKDGENKKLAEKLAQTELENQQLNAIISKLHGSVTAAEVREHNSTIRAEYWSARCSALFAYLTGIEGQAQQLMSSCTKLMQNVHDQAYKTPADRPTIDGMLNSQLATTATTQQAADKLEAEIRQLSVVRNGPRIPTE